MRGWLSGPDRRRHRVLSPSRLRAAAIATAGATCLAIFAPGAAAVPAASGGSVPSPKMFGYAAGPAQRDGTAAGKAHYVPASATRAGAVAGHLKGHQAPIPALAPPPVGSRTLVTTGSADMPAGHLVAGSASDSTGSAQPSTSPSPSASPSPSPSPSASPSAGSPASLTAYMTGGTDNASYSVASTFDTVPMANQSGRIAVTLTNTGTSTWTGYVLRAKVFPSGNTTGTGTPLTTGPAVAISGTVAPNETAPVESVTPAENPGSYEICWDVVNAAGAYFSSEGGNQFCAPYTIQQYPPQVNEQEPLPGTDVDTQTPELSASAVVPGGFPANPVFSYAFRILNGPNPNTATVLQSSGWVAGSSNGWTPTTALTWGTTYYWQVTVSDAVPPPSLTGSGITWTTPISFVVGNAQPTVSHRLGNAYQADDGNPIMTSDLGGTDYNGSGKTVDPRTGNIAQQATDASVATVGPPLSIVRTYNSLDPRTSQALGAGWSSVLDMALVPDPDGSGALVLTLADGQQIRFAKNSAGGYAPPQDMYAVVSALSGGGFAVTDQTDTTYQFGQASGSSWLISAIVDNTGKAETFGYSGGTLATISSTTSARALHLTWSTPTGATTPHVATVATDPATAGQPATALTWTYGYTGDLLSKVCPPGTTTACTNYGYSTSGSHAPTSVMNANPTSYYRLNDAASATVAANQVPVDDLTTLDPPTTEFGTTRGVAGPVSGVTATSFNGTSSLIPLDGAWCSNPAQQSSCLSIADTGRVLPSGTATQSMAVSIWFKTSTAASGILLGVTDILPDCGSGCFVYTEVPVLWIGSNGHLNGLKTTATDPNSLLDALSYGQTFVSPAAVNDGAWHQAVLVPGQAMYLDGQLVGTGSTSLTLPTGSYALLGTGLLAHPPCGCYESASWSYFNGSMADLSIYHNQLPSAGAVAAQYAAETHQAAELTSVTSPAGRSELSATYDTAGDRVATLTDADGGTWTYGGAVPRSSSAAYDSAVLANSPEDFWPLNDTAGPLATDMVGNAPTSASPRPPATYTNVTLGAAGPTGFPDGTAASFNGTSSQVSIPGGYFGGTGAESAELWFKTTGHGTLLSSGSGSNGEPMSLWVPSGQSCLEGKIGSTTLNAPVFGFCTGTVNDGKWHQAALTLTPGATSSGHFSQTATLYVDGAVLTTAQITTQATVSPAGYVATIGNGSTGRFTGSIADVSFYTGQLTPDQVTGDHQALTFQVTAPGSGVTLPTLNTQTITVTNPVGKNAVYTYGTGALTRVTDVLGGVTSYGYDAATRAVTITDPDGDTSYMTYDAHNNVTSTTTCAAVSNCQTSYASYYENLSNPLDPRNDKPTDSRDARSSSPSDPAYDTKTSYTSTGQIATETTPPTSACPSGCTTANAFTSGSEPAVGGGTEPPGLLASVASPGGGTTSFAYDSAGDVMRTTDPLGLVMKYTFDNIGRKLTQSQISDTYPAGLTTGFVYDNQDRLATETDPPVTDRVTGSVHTETIGYTYDADSGVLTTTLSDPTGGDPSRTMTNTYNSRGQLATASDALGNTTSYTYDALGDIATSTDPAGQVTAYAYDAAGNLLTTTLQGYTGNPANPVPPQNLVETSRAYDPAGRLASVTDVMGTTTAYAYYDDNLPASSYIVCSGCGNGKSHVTTYGYDAAGSLVTKTSPGALVTNTVLNAANQVVSQTEDPAGANRAIASTYDPAGNVISQSLTGGGVTQTSTATYNALGQELTQTNDNTGGNLTTRVTRDQRGLVISETDPAGNVTVVANDEAGRPVVDTGPAVQAQTGNGSPPVSANPVAMTGYDTFGDRVESSDPDGSVTTVGYDADGHQVSVTDPSYTPPGSSTPVGGTATMTYNNLGEQTKVIDPLGNSTQFGYDQLGDLASQTDPDGGVWTYAYDPGGDQTSVTDPTGAQTQTTYDNLGEQITTTDLVRQNASAAYTTSYAYNDAGDQVSHTSPAGVTTTAAYDPLGERIRSTDGAGNTTSYVYNLDGDLTKVTAPDGTAATTSYDLTGRPTSVSDLSVSGSVLRTASAGYDPDGNLTSFTDFRGDTATASYDATGLLTSQTEPTSSGHSVTVSYGYDLAGNPTAATDGNGNTTYASYNSLSLPQVITQPPTAAHSSAADSTTTNVYDADGNLVTQDLPGGVQVSSTFNAMGELTGQSGSGAAAPTATRTYTYDTAGRVLTAATSATGTAGTFGYQPATSESFGYDDRGLLLSASGSAGTSTFTYNTDAQLASVTDAAGASSYSYDTAGRLATDADAASGVTGTYSYNSLDQVTQISYGTGKDAQTFGYDSLHRLASDTISTAGGSQVASIGYGYDANDNVTSMTTSGLATAGGGTGTLTNTYGYDQANRLTSWTATPAGGTDSTKTYGYDNNGNLVNNNGVTQAYDARNELTSDSNGNSYTYTASGNIATQSSPGNANYFFTSDAYGQQITDGISSFAWDALGRVTSAGEALNQPYSVTLTYDGMTGQIASDPSAAYSRDPAGQVVGVDTASGVKTLAIVDQHDDLSGTFTATGTSLVSSTTWDPWGQVLASTGPAIQVGYQGQWTDPITQQVSMGSRFYRPPVGGFTNADTAPTAGGNSHAYVGDNPMSLTDPTGHSPSSGGSGNGTVTKADVDRAAAHARDAKQAAQRAETAAAHARFAAARARATASSAVRYAADLNNQASELRSKAELASAAARQAKAAADQAYAKWQQAQAIANQARNAIGPKPTAPLGNFVNTGASMFAGSTSTSVGLGPCVPVSTGSGAVYCGVTITSGSSSAASSSSSSAAESEYQAELDAYNGRVSTWAKDQAIANQDKIAYDSAKRHYDALQKAADKLWGDYSKMHSRAVDAQHKADYDIQLADQAEATAKSLTSYAANAEKAAAQAEQEYLTLKKKYDQEQREEKTDKDRQSGNGNSGSSDSGGILPGGGAPGGGCPTGVKTSACRKAAAALTEVTKDLAQVAAAIISAVLGPVLQSIASCVTRPTLASCAAAIGNIVLIGAGFADAGAEAAADGGLADAAAICGGLSFSANTKVLLANGKAVPISQLKPGDKVLATNTKTGKTQAETITAILVHHDTNLYDLKVQAGGHAAVIQTTSNHPFWDAGTRSWVEAADLKYGTGLRTPVGGTAVALGGYTPKTSTGWMWDLTVTSDHDFYVQTATTAVLVHNCPTGPSGEVSRVEQGQAGVNQTIADIEAAGGRILGREVGVRAGGGWRPRFDLYVELPSGQRAFIEVKTGDRARLTAPQEGGIPPLMSQGGVPYGRNAAAAGLTPGVPIGPTPVWIVHQPWPLGGLP